MGLTDEGLRSLPAVQYSVAGTAKCATGMSHYVMQVDVGT